MPPRHDTWMPLYVGDYLKDTQALQAEQHGAYLLLIMAAWNNGGTLPDDPEDLAAIARVPVDRWQSHTAAKVLPFFRHDGRMLVHDRVLAELERARANVVQKSRAGAVGAAARWHKDGSRNADANATALRPQWQTDAPSPSPIQERPPSPRKRGNGTADRFEDFWLAWPKNERKQDKAKCLDHWRRNGLDETADAILADVRTKRGTEKWRDGFIEAPLVYLRGKRWQDGVTPNEGPTEAAVDWRATWRSIVAKGVELGCGEWSEELQATGKAPDFPAYRAKVERAFAAAEKQQGDAAGASKVADLIGSSIKRVA